MVLANSDDLTLASSRTYSNHQLSAVEQFRASITRALHTHLQMTTTSISTFSCCGNCCRNIVNSNLMSVNCCCMDNCQSDNDGDVENHQLEAGTDKNINNCLSGAPTVVIVK